MSNYIDFKSSVDEWYRTQSKDNSWAKVLNALDKGYAQAEYLMGSGVNATNIIARQNAQAGTSSLYAQFKNSRQNLSNSGFSEGFQKVAGASLTRNLGTQGASLYAQSLAENSVSAGKLDKSLYDPYNAEVAGVASVWQNVFSYFNQDKEKYSDTDYAVDELDLLDNKGNLTGKGKMYLKYYWNTDSSGFGDESTDPYYTTNGDLQSYLHKNISNLDPAWASAVSEMSGINLQSLAYSEEEKKDLFGETVTTIKSTDIQPPNTIPQQLVERSNFGTSVMRLFGQDPVTAEYRDYSNRLKQMSDGWIDLGRDIALVINEQTTKNLMGNYSKQTWKAESMVVNGLSVLDAIKYGALSNGDTFEYDGISYIVYNDQPRLYFDAKTAKKFEEKGIKLSDI